MVKTLIQNTTGNQRAFTGTYVDPGGAYGRPVLGNVYHLNSASTTGADSPGYGVTPDAPYLTLHYAAGRATASNGDAIQCASTHSETFTTAGACSITTAGLTVIGTGVGNSRTKFQVSTATTAGMVIAAAGFWMENVVYNCTGIDADTIPLSVAAADCTLENIQFNVANATNQATCAVRTTAAANNLTINNCVAYGTTDAGTTAAIILVGGDGVRITNNTFIGAYSSGVGAIQGVTTDTTNALIDNNKIMNTTASSTKAFVMTASSTGMISNNRLGILSGTAPLTAAAMVWGGGNSSTGAVGTVAGAF